MSAPTTSESTQDAAALMAVRSSVLLDPKIVNADCLIEMPTMPAQSVDCVMTDLPYGTTDCKWDSMIPLAPLWAEWKRLLKPGGAIVLTACQPFTSALVMSNVKSWWKFDETTWSYDTTCDNKFQFDNGGVNENGFKFCPYCGKPILQPADVEVREARKEWNDDEAA